MKIYELNISSRPVWKHLKFANIKEITYKGKSHTLKEIRGLPSSWIYDLTKEIKEVSIQIDQEPGKKERPSPDFMSVDISYAACNEVALVFLRENNIKFTTIPTRIINPQDTEFSYQMVVFPEEPLLDIKASNAELVNGRVVTKGRTYFSPVSSKLVIRGDALDKIKGIVRIRELRNSTVCDEFVKSKLEESGLTGFYFRELEISN